MCVCERERVCVCVCVCVRVCVHGVSVSERARVSLHYACVCACACILVCVHACVRAPEQCMCLCCANVRVLLVFLHNGMASVSFQFVNEFTN